MDAGAREASQEGPRCTCLSESRTQTECCLPFWLPPRQLPDCPRTEDSQPLRSRASWEIHESRPHAPRLSSHPREIGRSNQHWLGVGRYFAEHGLRGFRAWCGQADYSRTPKLTLPRCCTI